jgi:hypothetical protein
MQSDIADEINKTNLTSQIKRTIVAAMKKYRNKRFKFNKASSTFTTSDGQSVYPLPDGYIGDELIEVLDGNFRDTLTKRDFAWVADHDNHQSYKSEPRVYAIIDGSNMRLFPTPNTSADTTSGNYPLLVHYHKDLNADGITGAISRSASDSVTNAWMTDGFDLVRLEAKIRIYTDVIRGPEAAMEAQKLIPLRNDALRALVKEYHQAVASGSVQPYF